MVESEGIPVATGGVTFLYNPPYGDISMAVSEAYRRRGFGSYLVQKLKRIASEVGKIPAAHCSIANPASLRTLQKAGMLPPPGGRGHELRSASLGRKSRPGRDAASFAY